MRRRLALILVCVCVFAGCNISTDDEGKTTYSVDPNESAKIEAPVEGVGTLLQALTPLLGPIAGMSGTALLAALGVWRKIKPKLVEAQTRYEISNSAAACLVDGIEELKKTSTDATQWPVLQKLIVAKMEDSGVDTKVLENFIRGLRGLQPKE